MDNYTFFTLHAGALFLGDSTQSLVKEISKRCIIASLKNLKKV